MTDLEKLEQLLEDFKIESETERHLVYRAVHISTGKSCVCSFLFNENEEFTGLEVED